MSGSGSSMFEYIGRILLMTAVTLLAGWVGMTAARLANLERAVNILKETCK